MKITNGFVESQSSLSETEEDGEPTRWREEEEEPPIPGPGRRGGVPKPVPTGVYQPGEDKFVLL